MTTRKYSSRSQQTTLTGAITSGATSMTVVSGTALLGGVTIPAGQTFTLVIDVDTALEEIVDATAVSTNTFTITRAIDGSTAQDHSAGAVVRHMAIGRDYRDANLHAEASAYYNDGSGTGHTMHGIGSGEGDVVGTAKSQTLTNKTLTSPTISNPTFTGTPSAEASIIFEGSTADAYETTLTVVDPTQDNTITLPNTTGTVVIVDATQTLTNKTLTSPTISGSPVITGLSSAGMISSSATPKDYVDSILGSATAAATSAASAATSAASAATSASSASTSASSALTSANSASTSATSAATSATSAATSASAASTSATSAANSATAASTSATSAATSASSASTSASSALTSANSASTSASSALTSANSAATSATAAATSATSAAASATAAATSATSAAASATAAATSAASAAASATAAAGYVVPSQTGNEGKFLGTDGSAVSWTNIVSANTSGNAFEIRQTGAGNAFVVEDETNPDSTPFVITAGGNVGIGGSPSTAFQIYRDGALVVGLNRASTDVNPVNIFGYKARGTNAASTTVVSGDGLLTLQGHGYDGASNIAAANIAFSAEGTISTGVVPGRITFATANSSGTNIERMRIDSAGLLGIGTSPSGAMVDIVNNTASNIGLRITGAASQSANLLSVVDVSSGGTIVVGSNGAQLSIIAYSSSGAAALPRILNQRARGTSASPTAVQSGDTLFALDARGYGATTMGSAGVNIQFYAAENYTDSAKGTYMTFGTTATGSTLLLERMRIDSAGGVGIGGTAGVSTSLRIVKNITGAASVFGLVNDGIVQADATSEAFGIYSALRTVNSTFTLGTLYHYGATQGTFGASSTVTNQIGYLAGAFTGATNNFGFYGNVAAGSGRWNVYMNGTAANYFAGRVGIGATLTSGVMAQVTNTTASDIGFIVKGAASQTGNLLQVRDSADSILVRVDSSGQVGIGISPSYKLDIALSGNDVYPLRIINTNTASVTTKVVNMIFGGTDTVGGQKPAVILRAIPEDVNFVNASFAIFTRNSDTNTERMRIDSSGNVGIGTQFISSRMNLAGSAANQSSSLGAQDIASLTINNNNGAALNVKSKILLGHTDSSTFAYSTVASYYASYNGANDIGTGLIFGTQFNAAGGTVERMRIDQSGNIGVGTTAPTAKLDVDGSVRGTNLLLANPIINSGFDIYQRSGTPTTGITTAGGYEYTLDRWISRTAAAGGSMVTSRQTTSDTTNLPFIQYCARVRRSTGNTNTNNLQIMQALETANSIPFVGRQVTLSFYARKSAGFTGTFDGVLASGTGTDQQLVVSFTNLTTVASVAPTLSTTWTRYTATGTVSSSATQIGVYFSHAPSGTAGSDDYYEVTGVQIDLGNAALPFRRSGGTLAGELQLAQRYYQKSYSQATAPATITADNGEIFIAVSATNTQNRTGVRFSSTMRTAPTVTIYSTNSGTAAKIYNETTTTDLDGVTAQIGDAAFIYRPSSGTTSVGDILRIQWQASAEL